jgi:hypothetical protein
MASLSAIFYPRLIKCRLVLSPSRFHTKTHMDYVFAVHPRVLSYTNPLSDDDSYSLTNSIHLIPN